MLGDLSRVSKIYIVTGRTDMRKSIDGLMSVIRDTHAMDPFANALYLFCGRKTDRIKALHYDQTGFVVLYKRLDSGRFQWPRNSSEVRALTRQQYRWLLEGLSIEQPSAIKGGSGEYTGIIRTPFLYYTDSVTVLSGFSSGIIRTAF